MTSSTRWLMILGILGSSLWWTADAAAQTAHRRGCRCNKQQQGSQQRLQRAYQQQWQQVYRQRLQQAYRQRVQQLYQQRLRQAYGRRMVQPAARRSYPRASYQRSNRRGSWRQRFGSGLYSYSSRSFGYKYRYQNGGMRSGLGW